MKINIYFGFMIFSTLLALQCGGRLNGVSAGGGDPYGGVNCTNSQVLQNGVCVNLTGGQDQNHNGLIEITTLEQLDNIRNALDGKWYSATGSAPVTTGCPIPAGETSGVCRGYELVNNLDFAGTKWGSVNIGLTWQSNGWLPLGDCGVDYNCNKTEDDRPFTATFDGKGYEILNLYIWSTLKEGVGLFGLISNARIANIGIVNMSVSGKSFIGGLVGIGSGSISSCYTTGSVSWSYGTVGGLVGRQFGSINSCYTTASVSGNYNLGGLVGEQFGSISSSYATGAVSGSSSIGGLVGQRLDGNSISSSYATGAVSGTSNIGGLVGHQNIALGSISSNYWDTTTTMRNSSGVAIGSATGLTTAEMQATTGTYPSNLGNCFKLTSGKYPQVYTWDVVTSACTNMLVGGPNATR